MPATGLCGCWPIAVSCSRRNRRAPAGCFGRLLLPIGWRFSAPYSPCFITPLSFLETVVATEPAPFATAGPAEARRMLRAAGEQPYRADQAQTWFWKQLAPSFDAMRTLPASARAVLQRSFVFSSVTPQVKRVTDDGLTTKYLFRLGDGRTIE